MRRVSALLGRFLRDCGALPHALQTRFAGSLSALRCQAPQTGHWTVARSACIADKTEGPEHGREAEGGEVDNDSENEAVRNVDDDVHMGLALLGLLGLMFVKIRD